MSTLRLPRLTMEPRAPYLNTLISQESWIFSIQYSISQTLQLDSRNAQSCSGLTGRTSGLPFCGFSYDGNIGSWFIADLPNMRI